MESPEFYKEKIEDLLLSTKREGIENVIEWLNKSAFYDVPASVKFHNNYAHGLEKHSYEVCMKALEYREMAIENQDTTYENIPDIATQLPIDSVIICSLLHDVCKHDVYYFDNKGNVKSRRVSYMKGHGQKSVRILVDLGLQMTELEKWAIWWHMGKYEVSRHLYETEYEKSLMIPLCRLIHEADSFAAKAAMEDDCF